MGGGVGGEEEEGEENLLVLLEHARQGRAWCGGVSEGGGRGRGRDRSRGIQLFSIIKKCHIKGKEKKKPKIKFCAPHEIRSGTKRHIDVCDFLSI